MTKKLSLLLAALTAGASLFPSSAKASAGKGDATKASEKAKITATVSAKPAQPSVAELQAQYNSLKKKFLQEQADRLEAAKKYIKEKEGYVDHPYLDCNGLIHTGYGVNINDKSTFLSLPFQKADGTELTLKEKEDYYKSLSKLGAEQKKLSKGNKHSANYYKDLAPYKLTKDKNEALFGEKIDEAHSILVKKYGYGMPSSLELAYMDLLINRGPDVVNEYVKFNAAYLRGDYKAMEKEITVKTDGNKGLEARNKDRQVLVRKAKTEKPSTTYMEFRQAAINLAQVKENQRAEAKRAALEKAAQNKAAGI